MEEATAIIPGQMAKLETLQEDIRKVDADLAPQLEAIGDPSALEAFRIEFLGRKGRISTLLRQLGTLDPAERAQAGQWLNDLKDRSAGAFSARELELRRRALDNRLAEERADVTLPGVYRPYGHAHPLSKVQDEIENTRKAVAGEDLENIKSAMEALSQASHKLTETLYQQAGPQPGQEPPHGGAEGPSPQDGGRASSGGPEEEVIDAEVVDDEKKN